MMTFEEFTDSVKTRDAPPDGLADALSALWWQRKGEWQKAHEIVLGKSIEEVSWVHAHLHREEGDLGNAEYWYTRAGRRAAKGDLNEEWEELVRALLEIYT